MWQETGAHCFVHIVEIDQVVTYAVPRFLVSEAKPQHIRCLVGVRKAGLPLQRLSWLVAHQQNPAHHSTTLNHAEVQRFQKAIALIMIFIATCDTSQLPLWWNGERLGVGAVEG